MGYADIVSLVGEFANSLALGSDHACAIVNNSQIRCWGMRLLRSQLIFHFVKFFFSPTYVQSRHESSRATWIRRYRTKRVSSRSFPSPRCSNAFSCVACSRWKWFHMCSDDWWHGEMLGYFCHLNWSPWSFLGVNNLGQLGQEHTDSIGDNSGEVRRDLWWSTFHFKRCHLALPGLMDLSYSSH